MYEGIEPEAPKSSRHKLVNPHYFSGVYDGADNRKLWEEVRDYLESHYDLEKVKRIDGCAKTEASHKRIAESRAYILSNWTAARVRLRKQEGVGGCSAEGHFFVS